MKRAGMLAASLLLAGTGACAGGGDNRNGGNSAGGAGEGGAGADNQGGSAALEYGLDVRPKNLLCKAPARPTWRSDDRFPQKLSATGCFEAADLRKPVAGVIPFEVNSPLWSDHAAKTRFLALPEGGLIKLNPDGDLDLPIGTVLLKTFEVKGQMLETRFLVHHDDGEWAGYTYVWDEAPAGQAKDATLLGPASESRMVGNGPDDPEAQLWIFPSRDNCLDCHSKAAGRSLGLEIGQLNRDFLYPNGRRANQIKTWDHIGLFEQPVGDPATLAAYPNPSLPPGATGPAAALELRARSYLHANCSHCHRPEGAREVAIDFRYATAWTDVNVCNVAPNKGTFGFPDAKLLAPGVPASSLIYIRMSKLIPNVRMPQIGTNVVDQAGVAVIKEWIEATTTCP